MNMKLISLLLFTLVAGGCASAGLLFDRSTIGAGGQCSDKKMKVYVAETAVWVTPRSKCVHSGETYTVKIIPIPGKYGARIGLKSIAVNSASSTWLNGKENDSNHLEITFTVPAVTNANKMALLTEHKYALDVANVGRLDPIVRVVD